MEYIYTIMLPHRHENGLVEHLPSFRTRNANMLKQMKEICAENGIDYQLQTDKASNFPEEALLCTPSTPTV